MKIVMRRKFLLWRVYIVGNNGEIVMTSETYSSEGNAMRAKNRLMVEWNKNDH